MNYIYLVTNKNNGKQYVGQTVRTIKERWYNHVYYAHYRNGDNNYFHNAIKEYGEDSFEITILEEVEDVEQLNDREIFYIKQYNTFIPNGYNTTLGGDGVRKHDIKRIQQLWDEGHTSKEICELEKVSPDSLQKILHGYKDYNPTTARKRSNQKRLGHIIQQFNKDGILIQEYPSIAEAARQMGVSDMAIGKAIKRGGTSCGFVWKRV